MTPRHEAAAPRTPYRQADEQRALTWGCSVSSNVFGATLHEPLAVDGKSRARVFECPWVSERTR